MQARRGGPVALCAYLVAGLTSLMSYGDGEVMDALRLEALMNEELRVGVENMTGPQPAPAMRETSPAPLVVAPAARQDRSGGDVRALEAALSRTEAELSAARAEAARLRAGLERVVAENRRERANMHYNVGCVFRAANMFEKARDEFLKAMKLAPGDAGIHYNLGVLFEEDLKDLGLARRHYEKFLELAPEDVDASKVREWLSFLP